MADTVKIFGKNVSKPVAFGGGALVLVGGVYYYRKNKAAQAAKASVDTAGGTSIDAATGYPYGSAEDAAALAAQGNYNSPTDFGSVGGYGFTGYSGGSGGGVFGTGTPGSFNSNAEWAQYVEAYEINNMGADSPTVGNAIGKYLTGQPLTSDQVGIVQSAIAIAGYPPVNGPNGNPPSYVTGTTGTTTPPADKLFHTTGGKTLTQIAAQLKVSPPDIVSKTSAKNYNKGKAWPYLTDWNKVIPVGITLVY